MRLNISIKLYLLSISAGGLALVVFYTLQLGFNPQAIPLFFLLFLLSLFTQIYEIEISPGRGLSTSVAVLTVAIYLGGAPLAVWVALLSTLISEIILRRDLLARDIYSFLSRVGFNTGQLIIAVSVAAELFIISGGHSPPWTTVMDYLPPIIGFLAFNLVNITLVSGIMHLTEGINFAYQFRVSVRSLYLQFLSMGVLAILLAIVYSISPWYMILMLIPLGLVHSSLRSYMRLRRGATETFERMMSTLEARDPYTAEHSEHVAELSERIARKVGLPEENVERIRAAARIHDIGKIGIPDRILLKNGKLTDEEWEIMKKHPVIGADLLEGLEVYERSIGIVRHEHERWNGSGYPDGLRGENIPLGARVVAVADVYDALTTDRPYRKAFATPKALEIINEMSGVELDPSIVEAFLALLKEEN
jgi:putative nucleotidyltransferase with HDIG domain